LTAACSKKKKELGSGFGWLDLLYGLASVAAAAAAATVISTPWIFFVLE
jgi:hypothetical protein